MNRYLTFFFTLLSTFLFSQERPKVGLVLSGGSAHGLAHIGVLKVLEEQGVQVDYITGTSIGSIVGGLYAMGLTASEIQKLTEAQDWSVLLTTEVPLNEIAPSEKLYHDRYGLALEVRDGGLKLPQGFFSSQKLDLLLNRMFTAAHEIRDFDNLPYPFKCVSVNIENGDIEVLDKGYLGNAIRSSMAIPSIFEPVEIDGKLLVDGGLIRNFPVDEVRGMGADIVIGVYVGSKLEDKKKLNNLLEILNQSAFMMGILDSDEQKKKVDILIEPDVKDYPNFGFDNSGILIREGYISATSVLEEIKELATAQREYKLEKPKPLTGISKIRLADTRVPFIRKPFDALAHFKYGGHIRGVVTIDEIEHGITRIFGTKHFDNINYLFRSNSRGEKILEILARPRKVNSISGTFNYLPSSGTSLVLTNELRNIGTEPSVLYTTVRFAENYGVKMDFNYRLGRKKDYIFNLFNQINRYDQNLYEHEILRERYAETNVINRIGIGYEPNNNLLVAAGFGHEGYFFKPIGLDEGGLEKYQRFNGTLYGILIFNNLDDTQFSNNGIQMNIGGGAHAPIGHNLRIGSNSELEIPEDKLYFDVHLKGYGVITLLRGVAGEVDLAAGYKSKMSFTDNYRIGGLENRDFKSISMIGLNTHQVHFSRFYKAGFSLRFNLLSSVYLSIKSDYLKGQRTFYLIDTPQDEKDVSFWGIGAMLGLRTPIGPINLAYGRNTFTNSWNTNFTFGYSFF